MESRVSRQKSNCLPPNLYMVLMVENSRKITRTKSQHSSIRNPTGYSRLFTKTRLNRLLNEEQENTHPGRWPSALIREFSKRTRSCYWQFSREKSDKRRSKQMIWWCHGCVFSKIVYSGPQKVIDIKSGWGAEKAT